VRRRWLALAVLALTALLLSLDVSVLYLALPELSADLGASTTQQLWMLDIYSFVLAGFLVTMGAVGDRIGRKRLLLAGAVAFGLASAAAAYSSSPGQLILWRAVLGIAGATLMPSTMGLIRTIFTDEKQMMAAIGVWYSCFMGGMAVGPLVGGLLLQHFWWGSAFLLGVPFMLLLVVVGRRVLPESERHAGARVDVVSSVLSLATILPVIHGFKEIARGGSTPTALLTMGAGALLGIVFVRRQRRIANPLVDLALFRSRAFSTALTVMLVSGVVMAGVSFLSSQWLQLVAGLDPLGAGLWMLPANVALLVGSASSARIAQRWGTGRTMATGLLVCAAGLVLLHAGRPGAGAGAARARDVPDIVRDHAPVDADDGRHDAVRPAGACRLGRVDVRDLWGVRDRGRHRRSRVARDLRLPGPARAVCRRARRGRHDRRARLPRRRPARGDVAAGGGWARPRDRRTGRLHDEPGRGRRCRCCHLRGVRRRGGAGAPCPLKGSGTPHIARRLA
jgi:MFS family permease